MATLLPGLCVILACTRAGWALPPVTATALSITTGSGNGASVPAQTTVTLTATVMAGGAPVSPGQVLFCDAAAAFCSDIHIVGMAQLTPAGTAILRLIPGPGMHRYKAIFKGTNSFTGSTSASVATTVAAAGGPIGLTLGVQEAGSAEDYSLLGTIVSNGPVPATGTITFYDTSNNNYFLGTAALGPTGTDGITFRGSYAYTLPIMAYTPGAPPGGWLAMADFNGDGSPDLIVDDTSQWGLTVLISQKDGTFSSAPVALPPGAMVGNLATGDFNGDGNADFAVAVGGEQVAIYLGNGDGTFTAGQILAGPVATGTTGDIVAGDFNGDGIADLAVYELDKGGGTSAIQMLLGNGDGTFTATAARIQTPYVYHLISADFNGDGKADLAMTSTTPWALSILLGNGDGTFAAPSTALTASGGQIYGLVAVDLNGDGIPDLVVTGTAPGVLLGHGDGTFKVLAADPNLNNGAYTGAAADFNGDGIADLILPGVIGSTMNVFLGRGDGTFIPDQFSPLEGMSPSAVVAGDFNGDGQPDIALTFSQGNLGAADVRVMLAQAASTSAAYLDNIWEIGCAIHDVVFSYSGDSNYQSATSPPWGIQAAGLPVNVTLTANPPLHNAVTLPVTFTATVSPYQWEDHVADASVWFYFGAPLTQVASVSLVNGTASWTTSTLPIGTDTIQVEYTGDCNFANARRYSIPYVITATEPPTQSFAIPNHTFEDPPFTIAAVSNSPGPFTYTVTSGPATISGSTVTLTGGGTVTVQASEAASGVYQTGVISASFQVAPGPQTISFAGPASPAFAGAPPLPLAATASSGLPVAFSVVSGPATVQGSGLIVTGAGTIAIAADQPGNANYAAAPEVTRTLTAIIPKATVSLVVTPNPVYLTNSTTFTATVSSPYSGDVTPTGTVSFSDGGVALGSAAVVAGVASISVSSLALGAHSMTASYGGNASYAAATSPATTVTVEDFALQFANPSVTIPHGGTAVYTLTVASTGTGMTASAIQFTASGAPGDSQLTFNPATIPPGSGTTAVTLTIRTPDYPVAGVERGTERGTGYRWALAVLLLPLVAGRRWRRFGLGIVALFALLGVLSGCGSGWPAQQFTVQVTATSGQLSRSATAVLLSE